MYQVAFYSNPVSLATVFKYSEGVHYSL